MTGTSTSTHVVEVCVDCYYALNGIPVEQDHEGHEGHGRGDLLADASWFAPGSTDEWLADALGITADEAAELREDDPDAVSEAETADFGTARCEGCGCSWAGSRHAVTVEYED